jgi:hypothetical protein
MTTGSTELVKNQRAPLNYAGLRLGFPWIARLPEAFVVRFPKLTNHFFLLRARTPTNTSTHKGLQVPA